MDASKKMLEELLAGSESGENVGHVGVASSSPSVAEQKSIRPVTAQAKSKSTIDSENTHQSSVYENALRRQQRKAKAENDFRDLYDMTNEYTGKFESAPDYLSLSLD